MKRVFLGALALAALTAQSAVSATIIDDFGLPGVGLNILILPDSNPQTVVTPLSGGTTRTATFTVTSGLSMFALLGGIGGGSLVTSFNPTAGITGNVTLDYVFAAPLDFSSDQLVEVVSTGSGFDAAFTIITSTGNLVLSSPLPSGPGPKSFYFSSFTGSGDLTQVTGFQAVLSGASGASLSVDSISVTPTPEPGTALLLALPVLAVLRRRKN